MEAGMPITTACRQWCGRDCGRAGCSSQYFRSSRLYWIAPMLDRRADAIAARFPALRELGGRRARRLRFISQTSDTDCGAACLAMLLAYFGRDVRVGEIANDLNIGRNGVNARAILDVARRHGLRGRGV